MYLLVALGIGLALAVLLFEGRAFARKQDQLYQQKHEDFHHRKMLS